MRQIKETKRDRPHCQKVDIGNPFASAITGRILIFQFSEMFNEYQCGMAGTCKKYMFSVFSWNTSLRNIIGLILFEIIFILLFEYSKE